MARSPMHYKSGFFSGSHEDLGVHLASLHLQEIDVIVLQHIRSHGMEAGHVSSSQTASHTWYLCTRRL